MNKHTAYEYMSNKVALLIFQRSLLPMHRYSYFNNFKHAFGVSH